MVFPGLPTAQGIQLVIDDGAFSARLLVRNLLCERGAASLVHLMRHVAGELCFRDFKPPAAGQLRWMGTMNPAITALLSRLVPSPRRRLGWIRAQRMVWQVEWRPPLDAALIPEVVWQMVGLVPILVEYTDRDAEGVFELLARVTREECREVEDQVYRHTRGF
jgi:hypothetical protein